VGLASDAFGSASILVSVALFRAESVLHSRCIVSNWVFRKMVAPCGDLNRLVPHQLCRSRVVILSIRRIPAEKLLSNLAGSCADLPTLIRSFPF
jgi:hypothetical protein